MVGDRWTKDMIDMRVRLSILSEREIEWCTQLQVEHIEHLPRLVEGWRESRSDVHAREYLRNTATHLSFSRVS